ncbi:hypothetical protein TNCV_1732951 [Trichonephila clavipes]|nr:hypothetical protein TNCV_1732951 [Trichonephila clavipes]
MMSPHCNSIENVREVLGRSIAAQGTAPMTIDELKSGCGCHMADKDPDKQYETPGKERPRIMGRLGRKDNSQDEWRSKLLFPWTPNAILGPQRALLH